MEEAVKDAILTATTDDPYLAVLIDLTASSIHEDRPLYPNLRDEPLFYRKYIKRWVREGLDELRASRKVGEDA